MIPASTWINRRRRSQFRHAGVERASRTRIFDRVLDELRRHPSVEAASLSSGLPFGVPITLRLSISPLEQTSAARMDPQVVTTIAGAPSMFRTLGVENLSWTRFRRSRRAGRATRRGAERVHGTADVRYRRRRRAGDGGRPDAVPDGHDRRRCRRYGRGQYLRGSAATGLRAANAALPAAHHGRRAGIRIGDECGGRDARGHPACRSGRGGRHHRDGTIGARRTVSGPARARHDGGRPRRDHAASRYGGPLRQRGSNRSRPMAWSPPGSTRTIRRATNISSPRRARRLAPYSRRCTIGASITARPCAHRSIHFESISL